MPLTQDQIVALIPYVQRYSYHDLDVLLRRATGKVEIEEFSTEKTVPPERALGALDRASAEGYEGRLFREMLKQPGCDPEFRKAVLTIFPDLELVGSAFKVLVAQTVQLIAGHRDRLASLETRGAADAFASALLQLSRYKGLHAAIMRVPNTDLPLPPNADGDGLEPFLEEIDQLLGSIDAVLREVRLTFSAADIAAVPQTAWIAGFDKTVDALRTARATSDADGAVDLIDDVAGQATFMLDYASGVISATYGLLPFGPLRTALDVAEAREGLRNLDALREALEDTVLEYDQWQRANRGLVRLDRSLRAPPREAFVIFTGSWRRTKTLLTGLFHVTLGIAWVSQAREAMEKVDDALARLATQPNFEGKGPGFVRLELKGPLDALRVIARNRLLSVATTLKAQLGELAALQASLAALGKQP